MGDHRHDVAAHQERDRIEGVGGDAGIGELDQHHRPIKQRIQVGNFETACRMIEAGVGVGVLPESAASRHAQAMQVAIVPLSDAWSVREMQICMRSLDALPSFAQELVELLVADAQGRLQLD
jgi:DNA-binding transcriptional LysR family regulator